MRSSCGCSVISTSKAGSSAPKDTDVKCSSSGLFIYGLNSLVSFKESASAISSCCLSTSSTGSKTALPLPFCSERRSLSLIACSSSCSCVLLLSASRLWASVWLRWMAFSNSSLSSSACALCCTSDSHLDSSRTLWRSASARGGGKWLLWFAELPLWK